MGIGGTLAAARSVAGLTVDQVSERTRIRPAIIRGIEIDDYSACGGNFYARGHIRAIARAVGTDPAPLIEQYDLAHASRTAVPAASGDRDAGGWLRSGAGSGADGRAGGNGWVPPGGITAAEAFRPAMPMKFEASRRRPARAGLLLLVAALVAGAIAGFYLLGSQGSQGPAAATSHPAGRGAGHAAKQPSPVASTPPPSPSPANLPVASAEAFGPAGPSQGDYPAGASLAVDGNASTAWHTDWYATADLNGQPGTGLLLNMGHTVTITSVQLLLGPAAGGTVELRAGTTPSLADLPVTTQAAIPAGTLTLQPGSPVTAQYVLIWFTRLPPDNAGTYQAWVYNVSVSGTA